MNAVTVKNLTKVFRQGDEDIYAVDHVSFTVAPGEMEPIKVADPQAVSAVIDELANGTEYTVTIIADYKDGGMSAGVSVKATPTELISKVESDNVSKISFDKENAAIELYYTRPVDVKAIPVTFTLIEGATIDLSLIHISEPTRH